MREMTAKQTIVLDAMGVIFRAQDDVTELLVPFVRDHGCSIGATDLSELYERASLGHLDVDDFWRALGLDPNIEDEYLAGHDLNDGALDFLHTARGYGWDVWCLSNDVSRWSIKLRERFVLDNYFVGFVISGDIGFRKPSKQAYRCLIEQIGYVPDLFVDDRARNVAAADSMGIRSVRFDSGTTKRGEVRDFKSLKDYISA